MAQLVLLGTIFVALSAAGNSIYLQHNFQSIAGVVLGILSITASCILTYVFEFKFFLINSYKSENFENLRKVTETCGNLWKLMETFGNLLKPMEAYGNLWSTMQIHGSLCKPQLVNWSMGQLVSWSIGQLVN